MAAAGSVPARFAHHVRFAPSPPLDTCVAPAPLWGSRAGGWTPPRSAAAFTPRNHACLHHALARLPGQGGWPVVRASPVSPGIRERPFASVTSPHGIPLARTADSLVRVSRRVESAPNTVARHRGTSTAATTSPGTRPGTAGARVRARAPAPPPGCHPVTGPALGGARGGEPPAPAGGAGTVQAGRGPCPPPPLEGGGGDRRIRGRVGHVSASAAASGTALALFSRETKKSPAVGGTPGGGPGWESGQHTRGAAPSRAHSLGSASIPVSCTPLLRGSRTDHSPTRTLPPRGTESSGPGPHWASSRSPGRRRGHPAPGGPRPPPPPRRARPQGGGGVAPGAQTAAGRRPVFHAGATSPPQRGVARWDVRSPFWPAPVSGTLNSLCRVLFTVRSLYLCAIGLVPVFEPCEGWTSPFKLQFQAALLAGERGATLSNACRTEHGPTAGLSPGVANHSRPICQWEGNPAVLASKTASARSIPASQHPASPPVGAAHTPLSRLHGGRRPLGDGSHRAPLHSPLLGQSPLLLVPPPTDMLKLGGCLWAPSGGPACPQAPCSTHGHGRCPHFCHWTSICHGELTLLPVTAPPVPSPVPSHRGPAHHRGYKHSLAWTPGRASSWAADGLGHGEVRAGRTGGRRHRESAHLHGGPRASPKPPPHPAPPLQGRGGGVMARAANGTGRTCGTGTALDRTNRTFRKLFRVGARGLPRWQG